TVTFDRPQKLNALTFQVYADLRDLLTELPQRDDVRVLVITGTGRGFSSGGDVTEIIGELQTMDPKSLLAFTRMTGTVTQRMRECPLPIIASVNGVAAGAGAVIALAADLRILTFQVYADLRDLLTELQHPDAVPLRQFGQQVAKIRVHLERQGIELLRAVEGNGRDALRDPKMEVVPRLRQRCRAAERVHRQELIISSEGVTGR